MGVSVEESKHSRRYSHIRGVINFECENFA